MMTNEQQVTRAVEALNVLESSVYKDALESMKADIIEGWKNCPVRDREGQLLFLQLAKLCDKFDGIIRGYVEQGKLAQHKIDIDSVRNENVLRRWARKVA